MFGFFRSPHCCYSPVNHLISEGAAVLWTGRVKLPSIGQTTHRVSLSQQCMLNAPCCFSSFCPVELEPFKDSSNKSLWIYFLDSLFRWVSPCLVAFMYKTGIQCLFFFHFLKRDKWEKAACLPPNRGCCMVHPEISILDLQPSVLYRSFDTINSRPIQFPMKDDQL